MGSTKEHEEIREKAMALEEGAEADTAGQGEIEAISMLSLTIKLPQEPYSIKIMVSPHETLNDIRQSIADLPSTMQYTCYSLWFDGVMLNDFVELGSIEDIQDGTVIELHEDAYNEREARLHVLKIRDIIGLFSTRNEQISPLSCGLSALASIETEAKAYRDGKVTAPTSVIPPTKSKKSVGANSTEEKTTLHPMSGVDLNTQPSLAKLLPSPEPARPQCVKSLGLSVWNPPPANLKLKGQLLYLQVATLEGPVFNITCDLTGFYVSNCTSQKFDPSPKSGAGKMLRAHSLLSLLEKLSPLFKEALQSWQDTLNSRDPLTIFSPSSAFLAPPWLARPAPDPTADMSRVQEQFLLGGSDNLDTVRDWNEDLQSTREMPHSTIQERILRERLLNKLYFDFTEAAAKGAVLIAKDEIPPLNPNEARSAHIFLYNGIFFSFGADGIGTFANEGGDAAARYAVGKDLVGVRTISQIDVDGLCPLCTVIVDYCGKRIVAQSPVPGIFRQRDDDSSQIVYGGVDGRDVVAASPDFDKFFSVIASSLHIKKHTVWDKNTTPVDLNLSIETKGLEGTDGRRYILDLYRITPLDIGFLEASSNGDDSYPHSMAVLRTEAVEEYWKDKIKSYVSSEQERIKKTGKEARIVYKGSSSEESAENDVSESDGELETIKISGDLFALNPDVFSSQVPLTEEDKAVYVEDEKSVRELCSYVTNTLIPNLLADITAGSVSIPLDSTQLTKLMHKRGINMRYLGYFIGLIDPKDSRVEALRGLLIQEVIIRSCKYAINSIMAPLPVAVVPYAAAHFFNCILGLKLNNEPTIEVDSTLVALYADQIGLGPDFGFASLTASEIQSRIALEAASRFRFTLPSNWVETLRPLPLFRELSLKLGFQWRVKEYHFSAPSSVDASESKEAAILSNSGKSKKKNGKRSNVKEVNATKTDTVVLKSAKTTFTSDDLLNIVPVVKDSSMRSQLADEAIEAGRLSILQGQKDMGIELLLESLSLHEQIYGVLHPEVARAYSQLSMIYSGLEEKASAVDFARKAVVIAERTIGLDASETILMYLNLSLCEHANGDSLLALALLRHAFQLWKVIFGEGHPDTVTTMKNTAIMLQALKEYHDSRKWFEMSLGQCEKIFGPRSIDAATLYFQLSQALVLTRDSHGAVQKMREAYTIFHNELGPEDKNTKEAEVWLEQLTQSAVHYARQAKDIQDRKTRKLNIVPGASTKLNSAKPVGSNATDSTAVGAAAAAAASAAGATSNGTSKKSITSQIRPSSINTKSIEELVKYIGN
ncbi:clustered mitochondria-domain-containing protein [Dipodascopsis uninucleata]